MSESSYEPKGRKRYESNKTLAQIWTGRAIMLGVVAIIGLGLYKFGFNTYLLFARPDRDGALVWATTEGIGYSEGGGERSGVFKLPSIAGDSVQNPRFNIVGNNLVYYSPDAQSVCAVSPGQTARWMSVEAALGSDATIRDIRPMGSNAVLLVAYPKGDDPDVRPMPVAAFKYTFGTSELTPMEAVDAVFDGKGKSIARTGSGFTDVTGGPAKVVSWDYDFKSSMLVASEGKSVTTIASGKKNEFGLGMLYFIRSVAVIDGDVWMTAVKPFKAGYLLVSYSPDGAFKRLKLKDKAEIRSPFLKVTPEMLELLNQVSGGVTE